MNLVLDLVLLGIIILFAINGRRNGFLKTTLSLLGGMISAFLASVLSKPVGNWLGDRIFAPFLTEKIEPMVSGYWDEGLQSLNFSSLPESFRNLLSHFGIGEGELLNAASSETGVGDHAVTELTAWIAGNFARGVGIAISFLVLFVLIYIGIRILIRVFDLVDRLPVLNFTNKSLGLVLGLAFGLFFAVLAANVVQLLIPVFQSSDVAFLQELDLDQTYLAKILIHLHF